jgi:peptidoglycan-N-acetylglucosamine deacetylase
MKLREGALISILALLVVGLLLSLPSGRPARAIAARTPVPVRAVRNAPQLRYRPVGCRVTGPTVAYFHGPAAHKLVAIGFDDGPAADTPAFVGMLAREHVPATFFMIGEQVTSAFRSTLRRELLDGDVLGDHTYTHPDLLTNPDPRGQLARTIAAIRGLTGYSPCVFRPPYGDYDSAVVRTARSLGLATVMWDVDPSDWALPGTPAIEQRVLAQVRPGSIVISHDGGGPRGETLAAYPHIISALRARGYRFVTIPQLLGLRPVYRRCRLQCEGLGLAGPLPRGSIVEDG